MKRTPTTSTSSQRKAFTLVEMLAVVAIIAVLFVVALPAVRLIQGSAMQVAGRQVSTTMQLARQMAITQRVPVRFVFAVDTSGGVRADLICRGYTVLRANYDANGNIVNWTPLQDWQFLPDGVVFSDQNSTSYNTINMDPRPDLGNSGPRTLGPHPSGATLTAWKYFSDTNSMAVVIGGSTNTWIVGTVEFMPTGFCSSLGGQRYAGIRLVQGTVLVATNRTLLVTDTNNWQYVEYDEWGGRVRVRTRDSYRM
jgi:prepilin-type N-terminal cleavage/methylation domain-containing protein